MKNKYPSFLHQHYKQAMDAGIDHFDYILNNDLSDAVGYELEDWYKELKEDDENS